MKVNKNYVCAFVYGIFGSLGAICMLNLISMAAFHERYRHPYSYPFSLIAGFVSFVFFFFSFVANLIFVSRELNKVKILFIEAIITLVFFVMFLYIWMNIWENVHYCFLEGSMDITGRHLGRV